MDSPCHAVTLAKRIPTFWTYTYIFWMISWIYILHDISTYGVILDKIIIHHQDRCLYTNVTSSAPVATGDIHAVIIIAA